MSSAGPDSGPTSATAVASTETLKVSEQAPFVPGQLLVKFDGQVTVARIAELLAQHRATVIREYSGQRLYLIGLPRDIDVEQGMQDFNDLAEVEFAEPNHIYKSED